MKLTDLVGRLAVHYPGLCSTDAGNFDGHALYIPYQFRVQVSTFDLANYPDDILVGIAEDRIQDATRCTNA